MPGSEQPEGLAALSSVISIQNLCLACQEALQIHLEGFFCPRIPKGGEKRNSSSNELLGGLAGGFYKRFSIVRRASEIERVRWILSASIWFQDRFQATFSRIASRTKWRNCKGRCRGFRLAARHNKAINADILKHASAPLQHTLKYRLSRR